MAKTKVMTLRQAIQKAKDLGFIIESREWYASDYTLKLNEDTFEEREVWTTKKEKGWWVIFPSDYLHPAMLETDANGILFAIKEYENRFEAIREAKEKSEQTEQAMRAFRDKFPR